MKPKNINSSTAGSVKLLRKNTVSTSADPVYITELKIVRKSNRKRVRFNSHPSAHKY